VYIEHENRGDKLQPNVVWVSKQLQFIL
jgi:hypothetical protein